MGYCTDSRCVQLKQKGVKRNHIYDEEFAFRTLFVKQTNQIADYLEEKYK